MAREKKIPKKRKLIVFFGRIIMVIAILQLIIYFIISIFWGRITQEGVQISIFILVVLGGIGYWLVSGKKYKHRWPVK